MTIYGLTLTLLKKLMKIIERKKFIVGGYMNIKDYSQYAKNTNHKIINFKFDVVYLKMPNKSMMKS